jgi:Uma2 family endonuclease
MTLPQPVKRYTPQEYYALEREAEYKSDYYQGEIFNMSGGTANHSLISTNLAGEIRNRLKGKPCRAYESNLRLNVLRTGLRCYPDVSVYCGPLQLDPEDSAGETATNPTLLFEVLSKSTEAYDRGLKAENYRQIESLRAYVLVSQTKAHVEIFERQGDGPWVLGEANGLDAVLKLPAIDIELPLAEIYAGVEFPPPEATPTVTREL